jgi:hypothetical protein
MVLFPKQFENDLAMAKSIYESVEKTHKGLGKLALMDTLSDVANRCLLVIGCSGTGKSVVSKALYNNISRSKLELDAITVSGLKRIAKVLNYNKMSVIVDDLSKGQTEYSQFATVSVFSSLCYTGQITKFTGQLELQIMGFKGSTIINLQPLLMRKIARLPEFETDIRDKVIRYYHLKFPVEENITKPNLPSLSLSYVDEPNLPNTGEKTNYYSMAFDNFRHEFSKARAREHLTAYLNASARLNGRAEITKADYYLIYQLSRNFRMEPELFQKSSLEGSRYLDENLLPLLSAVATWKKPKPKELMYRFGIKARQFYNIIADLSDYIIKHKDMDCLIPTEETIRILREAGEL